MLYLEAIKNLRDIKGLGWLAKYLIRKIPDEIKKNLFKLYVFVQKSTKLNKISFKFGLLAIFSIILIISKKENPIPLPNNVA